MKKLAYILFITTATVLGACNGATQKTGGAVADSGVNHGNSGPTDTATAAGSGSPTGVSTSGTDTTKNGGGVTNPTVDSGKHSNP